MAERPFVHLHCHTHYSLLDGASRVPELVARVKSLGMNSVAVTDHGNLHGAIEFYQECKAAGINPIVGYEAYVAPTKRTDRETRRRGDAAFHLTLLAQNRTGFQNLIKMASMAFLEGYYHFPRIDKELLEAHKEGLICLSGCASSEFSEFILKDQMEEATNLARYFHQLFGKNFYVEIQNNGLEIQRQCAEGAIDIADKLGLPLVATSDAHYLTQADAPAHDVLLCINTRKSRADVSRMRYGSDQFYVRPPEEMYNLFDKHHAAVKRSQEIADGVHLDLDFKTRHFPVFKPPENKTPEQYLRELCYTGLAQRYGAKPEQKVIDRLELELGIICRMGFASYFLIVADFVRFAFDNDIPCGARGSACGALVSYLLKLTHFDPLDYDLLFERFLDPSRSEAPDIDIDFCQQRRDEVIAYVRRTYGEASVAQIATFGTMAAKAALRDVGRALDIPLFRVDEIAKMVPQKLGITLEEALAESKELKELYTNDPQIHELVDIARKLEGTNRNAGTHAAGVVISDGPLINHVPLQRVVRKDDDLGTRNGEAVVTTQWGMGDLEKVGLLKMDFLGLRTLTLLDNAVKLIKKTRNETIDIFHLNLDDEPTYKLLQRGDAKGVFQFESDGIRELLKRLRPDNIRDIIACTALYRPGPLEGGMVDEYINCKHGRKKPEYIHPEQQEILQETHGVMVYQEQVMRILNKLGGIELSSAYACIKAISKKKTEVIEQRRAEFIQGAKKRGVETKVAEEIFRQITVFGGYGFNKSHSAAYALVSYQTAYLKTHYPAEFIAALLSSEIDDGNKRDIMVEHIADAKRLGVPVLPPNLNVSESEFSVTKDRRIVFGMTAIRGFGRGAAEEVVRSREQDGPFKDLFDFCERVDLKIVNKAGMEKLVKAGVFDCLGGNRAQQMVVLPRAIQAASERQTDRKAGQRNLFEAFTEESPAGATNGAGVLPDVPDWSETEKLMYEKEVLDFYVSSHPLAQHEKNLHRRTTHTVAQLKTVDPGEKVIVGGMVSQIRYGAVKKARNGNTRLLRCKLEDMTGVIECLMWPDDLARFKGTIDENNPYIVHATLEQQRAEPSLVVSQLMTMEQAAHQMVKELCLRIRLDRHRPMDMETIADILRRTPGKCPVMMTVQDGGGKNVVLRLGPTFAVNPHTLDRDALEGIVGSDSVKLT